MSWLPASSDPAKRSRSALLAIAVYALFMLLPGLHALVHDHGVHDHAAHGHAANAGAAVACDAGVACEHGTPTSDTRAPDAPSPDTGRIGARAATDHEHERSCRLCEAFSYWGSPLAEPGRARPAPTPTARVATRLAACRVTIHLRAPAARGPPASFAA